MHTLAATLCSDVNFFLQNKPACVAEAKHSANVQSSPIFAGTTKALDTSAWQRPALATGRGEKVESLDFFPALRGKAFVLVHPGFGIATAWAYQQLAHFHNVLNGRAGRAQKLISLLQTGDAKKAGAEFYNSLEAPALKKYPVLTLYQEFFREHGALAVLMSGSGSTTFAVMENQSAGEALVEKFKAQLGQTSWMAVVPV